MSSYQGLTSAQANELIEKFGYNTRPKIKKKTWAKRLWKIFTEPMMLLILATAIVYYFIGDIIETMVFLCSIIPIGLMEFFQESKTDKAIDVLDKMMVQYAQVYRDGKIQTLDIKEIVPGDLIYLTAGDKVPADGFLINSPGLLIDESVLTGESLAVAKAEENKLSQGTLVVQGEGYIVIEQTGANTVYGKLGGLLEKISSQKTPLQQKIHQLIRQVALVALAVSSIVTVALVITKGWKDGLIGGLTMAMSLVPEEFPVVFSVFLIMGVWRMAKKNALVREMAMVETLGSATVICTDKTGTLTEGRMSLEKIYYKGKIFGKNDESAQHLNFVNFFQTSLLAFEKIATDPLEIEVQNFSSNLGIDKEQIYKEHSLIKDSPFDAKSKMVHHIWQNNKTKECFQYTAGAPEKVLDICKIFQKEKSQATEVYETMASKGYRMVSVARKKVDADSNILSSDLEFIGLLAMSDPPRAEVAEAVQICQNAGIRIIMITGDNKLTAHNIAENIKLKHDEQIINGEELEKLSPTAMQEAVRRYDIFARVQPEQKFLIVEALQKNGEIVAMTGDGVNDAPALKKANIGIAMGQKGTEVARASAGIVLMDDNFSSIVSAIKEGRRIYDNLRQSFVFLLSFHIPIVGLALIPVLFSHSLIFLPIHVIFLELICDPASVLGFEKEKARRGLMKEKPRSQKEPLIATKFWKRILIQGLGILTISLCFYYFGVTTGDAGLGRTLAFISLVISQTMLILLTREWEQIKSNSVLLFISIATLFFLILIVFVPALCNFFHFVPITTALFGLVVSVSFCVMVLIKFIAKKI
jgi:Ca2+-transporting ATPase